jgi:hypothetical protein
MRLRTKSPLRSELARVRSDRPPAVPRGGATNLGLIGQYVEVPTEIVFTIECSVRAAWEAIRVYRGPACHASKRRHHATIAHHQL